MHFEKKHEHAHGNQVQKNTCGIISICIAKSMPRSGSQALSILDRLRPMSHYHETELVNSSASVMVKKLK